MTIPEAKIILQGYRPSGEDAGDPFFAEALELARNDPGLRAWLAQEQELDRAMSEELAAMSPPSDLRNAIIAAAKSGERATVHPGSWSAAGWLAVAATLAFFCTVTWSLHPAPRQPVANSALADFAVGDAQHPKTHGGHGEEMENLNRTLKLPTTHLHDPLPVDFANLRDTGCRTLHVEGREVLEVCFKRNGAGLHCYIARRRDFPSLTAPNEPAVTDKINASIATWADSALIYVVVTKPDHALLEKIL